MRRLGARYDQSCSPLIVMESAVYLCTTAVRVIGVSATPGEPHRLVCAALLPTDVQGIEYNSFFILTANQGFPFALLPDGGYLPRDRYYTPFKAVPPTELTVQKSGSGK